MMAIMAAERGGQVGTMDARYCIDNGAMIAWAGYLQFVAQGKKGCPMEETTVTQRFRTDQVEAIWRIQEEEGQE